MPDKTDLVLYLIAGPNGCGKSTFTASLNLGIKVFDFDALARQAGALTNAQMIETGRRFLAQFEAHILRQEPAVLETTLTGFSILKRSGFARQNGYRTELHYLTLDSIQLAKLRVCQRVILGGHGIPDDVQERRFLRSRKNVLHAALSTDETVIWDNSTKSGPDPLVRLLPDTSTIIARNLPRWVKELVKAYQKRQA